MLSEINKISSRFITSIFISGINEAFINKLISMHNMNSFKKSKSNNNKTIYPEILFYYPQDESNLSPSFLEYIFIDGINIEFNLQPPKFIPEVLTDAKGERTYLYSIRLFDKIEINYKKYYLPYALSIWSPVNNCEAFKNILTEFYRIMKSTNEDLSNSSLINYHNLEFVHLIIFLTDIILPPYNSKMILNFHFSSIELNFPSLTQIPNNEEYIQLLFDCLEISAIIKLWCSVLSEKHIIFISNQGYLLFAITQGLLSLIFPFSWLYTYIPILPVNLIDYLDSPIPYIIGILANTIDINELNEKYPGHVICDLNSSTINKNGVSFLSYIEEDIIKKKIRYLYNPKLFEIEDIYLDENEKQKYNNKNFELEDIDMNKTFGENIHYIFFRIFRYQLNAIQQNYAKDKVFDVQIFLEEYCQDEMRDFWDKLTSTEAFDHFLMNLINNDNAPFSKIISKILSVEDNEKENLINTELKKEEEPFIIKYTLPSNMNYIMNQFTEMDEGGDDYGKALKHLLLEYNEDLSRINNNTAYFQKLSSKNNGILSKSLNKNYKGRKPAKKVSIRIKKDDIEGKNTLPNNNLKRIKSEIELKIMPPVSENISQEHSDSNEKLKKRETSVMILQNPTMNLFYLYGLDTIKDIEQKIIKNQLRKIRTSFEIGQQKFKAKFEENNDLLYHQDFLSFSKFFFVTLTLKKNTILGYRSIYIKKLKKLLNDYSSESLPLKNKKIKSVPDLNLDVLNEVIKKNEANNNSLSKDLEESSLENEIIFESSSDYTPEKDELKLLKTKSEKIQDKNILKSTNNEYTEYLDIIELNKIDSSQFSLMSAFLLELETFNCFNNNIYAILKLYERSFLINDLDFSYSHFLSFLNKLDYLMLHRYYQNIIDNKEYDNLKMKEYSNLLHMKLKQMEADGKGIRKRFWVSKSMKLNYSADALVEELKKRKFSRKINKLSTNSIFKFKNFMNLDNNFLNISLYNFLSLRKNSENEGNNPLKMNILNMYKKYKRTNKDPSQLVEEIGILINLFIVQKSLHKLQSEVITPKFLSNLNNTEEFKKIKDVVAELQVIDLKYILNVKDNHKTSFWLNILNFLVVFAVIYKKENILTNYEWHKLKKNSYFNIGGFNFSLQEIEMNIIGNNNKSKTFYEEMTSFAIGDSRNKYKIDNVIKYVNFGIFEPMSYSFKLQMYFPQTIEKQILKNAIDYFSNKIIFDGKKVVVKLPEYLLWVDDNFLKNLELYEPMINKDLFDFMVNNKDKVEFVKHDWALNFSHAVM